MPLQNIGSAASWTEAFAKAQELLEAGKLSAVALVSKHEYDSGGYVATHLEEFARAMGGKEGVLQNQKLLAPMLYGEQSSLQLYHGQFMHTHPLGPADGWLLAVVYPFRTKS